MRFEGDYKEFAKISMDEAIEYANVAKEFVEMVGKMVGDKD